MLAKDNYYILSGQEIVTMRSKSKCPNIRKSHLTLIGRGTWMLLESGWELNQPAPSKSPQNTAL